LVHKSGERPQNLNQSLRADVLECYDPAVCVPQKKETVRRLRFVIAI